MTRPAVMRGKSVSRGPRFFVSIGAGINQMPLILEAKRLGFQVIGVDANNLAAGIVHCDLKIQESAENYGEIYVKLREFLIDAEIAGALSKSYGPSIRTACYLAEKFDLPLVPFSRVEDFMSKESMKAVFDRCGIPSPRFQLLDGRAKAKELSRLGYPLVVKPAIGHAKKGVRLIAGEAEMKAYLADRRAPRSLVVEEYVEGDEIIAAGIVHEGVYHLAEISDKIVSRPPFFVDLVHLSPSSHFPLADKVKALGQRVADSFDIRTSPLIMEIRVDPSGGLFLIEAVPEFGGEFLPDILIPARTGYNFISEAIKAATGIRFTAPAPRPTKKHIAVKYITGRRGVFQSFNPEGPRSLKGVLFSRVFKDIGSEIIPPETNHDRIGVVIAQGRGREEAVAIAEAAVESLKIRIKSAG